MDNLEFRKYDDQLSNIELYNFIRYIETIRYNSLSSEVLLYFAQHSDHGVLPTRNKKIETLIHNLYITYTCNWEEIRLFLDDLSEICENWKYNNSLPYHSFVEINLLIEHVFDCINALDSTFSFHYFTGNPLLYETTLDDSSCVVVNIYNPQSKIQWQKWMWIRLVVTYESHRWLTLSSLWHIYKKDNYVKRTSLEMTEDLFVQHKSKLQSAQWNLELYSNLLL